MNKNQDILGTESITRLLIRYSVPAIIGMMVNALYNIVDRMFIGNIPGVGPLAITGLGVTMPIMSIIFAFGTLIGIGSTTNISIKLGERKIDKAEKILGNAISLSIILGFTITVIASLFLDNILTIFGASNVTISYAKDYMQVILLGATFSIMSIMFNNLIRGDGNPKLSAKIMAVGCLTNIVLDAILIFVFKMGIQGAAIATVFSQFISSLFGLTYYLKGRSNVKLRKHNLVLNKKIISTIFAIGMAPFAMQISNSIVQIINNTSLKMYGGDLAIGAMATISSINMIYIMPTFGFVQAMQPIIGYNYGAKNFARVKKSVIISLLSVSSALVIGFLLVHTIPNILVGMFNNDKVLMDITINGLRKYTIAFPIIGISIIGTNYIQSIGNAKIAIILSLLRQVIILIPMIIILPKFFGLDGIWYAQATSDIVSSLVASIVLFKEFKKYPR